MYYCGYVLSRGCNYKLVVIVPTGYSNSEITQLNAPVLIMMTTGVFSQNVSEVTSKIKLVMYNLPFICRSQLRSH